MSNYWNWIDPPDQVKYLADDSFGKVIMELTKELMFTLFDKVIGPAGEVKIAVGKARGALDSVQDKPGAQWSSQDDY